MNELIKITEKDGQQLVSARELHEFLGVSKHITQWIKPYIKDDNDYGFELNVDFMRIDGEVNPTNGLPTVDFAITIEMAKELSMVSKTEKGKQARKYFIQCEKKLREVVQAPKKLTALQQLKLQSDALLEVSEKQQALEEKVEDMESNFPLFNIECEELQKLVKKAGTNALGGYGTKAYKDNSLRQKVYKDIQHQLTREFGIGSYKAIKRCQLSLAKEIVQAYRIPTFLQDQVAALNNQIEMEEI